MTRVLCHTFYREFQNDPAIFMDMEKFAPFVYSESWADRYFDRQKEKKRLLFAVMKDGRPIGEVKLWNMDWEKRECCLGIHMQNDSVKGRGYGTAAERLAVVYAFEKLNMAAVNADVVRKNTRSQHVLEKVGFRFVREDETFLYYRLERA